MDRAQAERLYSRADAGRWRLPIAVFTEALERSAEKMFAGRPQAGPELDRYYDALHLSDLALSCSCAIGNDAAWDHFVMEFRPALLRAADAMDPTGGAREIAQALYAELFGLREKDGNRQSLFRYFHGRSSLATWLRSMLAQRIVDRHRETRRLEPLPDADSSPRMPTEPRAPDPDRERYVTAMRVALGAALAALAPRDRLRLACYYAQEMTLAQIGTVTREHEATVSRHLARTRKAIRQDVEVRLQRELGFSAVEVDECFGSLVDDAGNLDLAQWLDTGRKNSPVDRSKVEDQS
jgi:RNA polymerase sigma-70 factor (ECF subfamily)